MVAPPTFLAVRWTLLWKAYEPHRWCILCIFPRSDGIPLPHGSDGYCPHHCWTPHRSRSHSWNCPPRLLYRSDIPHKGCHPPDAHSWLLLQKFLRSSFYRFLLFRKISRHVRYDLLLSGFSKLLRYDPALLHLQIPVDGISGTTPYMTCCFSSLSYARLWRCRLPGIRFLCF